jgi:hypothetical protein
MLSKRPSSFLESDQLSKKIKRNVWQSDIHKIRDPIENIITRFMDIKSIINSYPLFDDFFKTVSEPIDERKVTKALLESSNLIFTNIINASFYSLIPLSRYNVYNRIEAVKCIDNVSEYIINHLPLSLKKLSFSLFRFFPDEVKNIDLSSSRLRVIDLRSTEYSSKSSIIFPETLEEIYFCKFFNREYDFTYLINLKVIVFGESFNQSFKVPQNLQTVIFGDRFNKVIEFPNTIQSVTFGEDFNQPLKIENLNNLKHINFGGRFDQEMEFPENIESIKILNMGKSVIPDEFLHLKKLKKLEFDSYMLQTDMLKIPESLEELHTRNLEIKNIVLKTSNKLKKLTVRTIDSIDNLPLCIEELEANYIEETCLKFKKFKKLRSIRVLTNIYKYNRHVTIEVPDSLESLSIGKLDLIIPRE